MKLVIDIPKTLYKSIPKDKSDIGYMDMSDWQKIINIVKNGIPLPKGHGRLIILSEDVVKREQARLSFSRQNWISEVGLSNATVAIIEADKAESEDKE